MEKKKISNSFAFSWGCYASIYASRCTSWRFRATPTSVGVKLSHAIGDRFSYLFVYFLNVRLRSPTPFHSRHCNERADDACECWSRFSEQQPNCFVLFFSSKSWLWLHPCVVKVQMFCVIQWFLLGYMILLFLCVGGGNGWGLFFHIFSISYVAVEEKKKKDYDESHHQTPTFVFFFFFFFPIGHFFCRLLYIRTVHVFRFTNWGKKK